MSTKPFNISKSLIWDAYKKVKSNGGSAGVDNQSLQDFDVNLGPNLYKIWNRMSSGSYMPPPVKSVPIRAVCAVTLSRFTGEKGPDIPSQNIYLGDSQTRHLKILGAEYRIKSSEPIFRQ